MSMVQMGGKPQGESIADDVISAEPVKTVSELEEIRASLNDVTTRINTLEIMIMRILDALELSHSINTFVGKDYYGP